MRSLIPILLCLTLATGCTSSCAKSPPTLSAAGSAAFQAKRVVDALDVVRNFAIDAEAQDPKVLSTDTTRKVVLWHKAAVSTIGAVPGGWAATVTEGLKQLEQDVLPADWARLQPYIALIRTLIAEVTR